MKPDEIHVVLKDDSEIIHVSIDRRGVESLCLKERFLLAKSWNKDYKDFDVNDYDKISDLEKLAIENHFKIMTLNKAIEIIKDGAFESGRNF